MMDMVNTDALRKAGERADYYQTGDGPLWRAAADEVDRLRALPHQVTVGATEVIRHVNAENDRLRAVIENAPHAADCEGKWRPAFPRTGYTGCTCWKATVL